MIIFLFMVGYVPDCFLAVTSALNCTNYVFKFSFKLVCKVDARGLVTTS